MCISLCKNYEIGKDFTAIIAVVIFLLVSISRTTTTKKILGKINKIKHITHKKRIPPEANLIHHSPLDIRPSTQNEHRSNRSTKGLHSRIPFYAVYIVLDIHKRYI